MTPGGAPTLGGVTESLQSLRMCHSVLIVVSWSCAGLCVAHELELLIACKARSNLSSSVSDGARR